MSEVPTVSSAAELLITTAKKTIMPGVTTWRNPKNGFKVIDLEFIADPTKRSEEWKIQSKKGMGKAEWEREYGSRWMVYEGKPVYQDYEEPTHLARGNIYALKRCRLISGIDAGPNDVNLAWALGLAFPDAAGVTFIDEYQAEDGDVQDFLEVVKSRLLNEWFRISGGFSVYICDQSVFTESSITKTSVATEMRKRGMAPIPGAISFSERRKCTQDLMLSLQKGSTDGGIVPKFRVHERCTLIREALSGGYCYPKVSAGVGGDYKPTPLKNKFSHIGNSVEYVCSRLEAAMMQIPYEGRALPRVAVI